MKILKSVSIKGLWGTKTFSANFFDDTNFLIGQNGSGKTTVINLIAAVLTADIPTLLRLTFSEIQLHLGDGDNEKDRSIVSVTKTHEHSRHLQNLVYRFEDNKGHRDYSTEELERHPLRRYPPRRILQNAVLEELLISA